MQLKTFYVKISIQMLNKNEIKKVLVMNLGGMGDLLLSVPALRSIKNLFPNAEVSLLTVNRSKDIARALPYIDNIIPIKFNTKTYRALNFILSPFEFLSTLWSFFKLRFKGFDMMVNFRTLDFRFSSIKTFILFLLVGAKYKIGRNTEGRGFFYDYKVFEPFKGEKSEIEYDLDLFTPIGGASTDHTIEVKLNENALKNIESLINSSFNEKSAIIGISPGAPWPSKIWPYENFLSLIKLLKNESRKIVIIGSKSEKALCSQLAEETDSTDFSGKFSFNDLTAFISKSKLFITNDTGVMHLTAALKTPMIALVGPGDLARYYPKGDDNIIKVLHHPQDCSPCFNFDCDSKKCLTSISVKEAFSACENLLSYTGGKK